MKKMTETSRYVYDWEIENHTSYDTDSLCTWIEEYLIRVDRVFDAHSYADGLYNRRVTPSDRELRECQFTVLYASGAYIRAKEPWVQYRTRLSLPEPRNLGLTAMQDLAIKLNLALGEQVAVSATDFYEDLSNRIQQIFGIQSWMYTRGENIALGPIVLAEMESEALQIRVNKPKPGDVKKAKKAKQQGDLKGRISQQTRTLRVRTRSAEFKLRQVIHTMRVVQGTVGRCVAYQTAEEEVADARSQLQETHGELMTLAQEIQKMLSSEGK
jgi:hypothetical protein